ncbi:AhpC/TSA family protein [Exilibacterium tricleocarpae]|uniref:AhpC/TSA family protein n=1 Tax=Exilibacterium tricleocarpae TaxID=2591008 RepID=A0A545SNZ8_9GAMM|nr:peroxiredoxin-like family protein [Exilibacterium tricleocarpae]TQV66710.1 AhpC/TSA family protein [Exilibacterium tricleocarpae]
MRKHTLSTACLCLALLGTACSKSTPPATTDTGQGATAEALDTTATVKVAAPRAYTSVEDTALGVNENGKGLEPGTQVTAVTIADIHGKPYPIQQAWAEKPALVIFYRGGWCPYCNMHVRDLSLGYPQLQAAGVQPLLISVDEPDKSAMVGAQYEIPFPVLSDPQLLAHEAFNVVLELNEETLAKYKEYGIDLKAWSGEGHNKIAVSSAFLIDQSGTVLFSHAPKDYRSRPSVEQLVAVAEARLAAR